MINGRSTRCCSTIRSSTRKWCILLHACAGAESSSMINTIRSNGNITISYCITCLPKCSAFESFSRHEAVAPLSTHSPARFPLPASPGVMVAQWHINQFRKLFLDRPPDFDDVFHSFAHITVRTSAPTCPLLRG